MKTTLMLLFLPALFQSSVLGQGTTQIVVPSDFASMEGNSSSADLFRTSSSTFQQVYSASEFRFAPTSRIDGISFRLDGASGQRFIGLWPSVSFILSTTTRTPDSLSPAYGDNAGDDSVEVFAGAVGIFATNVTPSLRPFEIHVTFTTPFFYDPSKGNLSLLMGTGPGPVNLFLDAHMVDGDSVGRVFGGISLNGTVDTSGLVTRFDVTPIPEPSTYALFALGAAALWFCRRGTR